MNIIQDNFKWADAYVQKIGEEYLDHPDTCGMFYLGFVFASFSVLLPAKTSYDLFNRSIKALSPKDFAIGAASLAATLFAVALSPLTFITISAVFLYITADSRKETSVKKAPAKDGFASI